MTLETTRPDPATITDFENSLIERGRSGRTAALYASQIRRFAVWFSAPDYDDERHADELARWINQGRAQGDSASTTRQRLAAARAWLTWSGCDHGVLGDYKAPPLPAPNPTPVYGGMKSIATMADHVVGRPALRCAVALGGYAGLRVSESLSVTWGDYDVNRKRLTVKGKGEKQRVVPVSSKLAAILEECRPSGPVADLRICMGLTDSTARKAITELAFVLGLPDVSSHDLRATYATSLFKATKDVLMVSKLLGHSSIATTQAYLSFDRDEAADAVEAL